VGLFLRLNAFRDADAGAVFGALATFYGRRGAALIAESDERRRYDLHERRGAWCVLEWDAGWEWKQRREAQLHVSGQLGVVGILVFVYDGEHWGYELFDRGEAVDCFVSRQEDGVDAWFPGADCRGNAAALARAVGVAEGDVAPYLVRSGRHVDDAVVDFMRRIEIDVAMVNGRVTFPAPIWRSFRPSFGDQGQ
jgi:hypothetical protein